MNLAPLFYRNNNRLDVVTRPRRNGERVVAFDANGEPVFQCKPHNCSIASVSPHSARKMSRLTKRPWQRIAWIALLAIVLPSVGFAYKSAFRWVGDWETMNHFSALKIYSVNQQYIRFEINTNGAHNSGMMLGSAQFDTRGHAIYHYPADGTATCTVEFKPVRAHLKVSASANSAECGLGMGVAVDGTYYR